MMNTSHIRLLLIGLAVACFLWPAPAKADPAKLAEMQDSRWSFNTDLGLWTGTTNDTTFALGFGLDYYMDRNFSFGGMPSSRRSGT